MAFFSSPSLPKLPFPWEPWSFPRTGWASVWERHSMSLGAPCQCGGETLGSNRSWIPFESTLVEEPSNHVLTLVGRVTHSRGLFLLGRGKRETKCGVGWEGVSWKRPTSFVPHIWALQPCASSGLQLPRAQVAVSRVRVWER